MARITKRRLYDRMSKGRMTQADAVAKILKKKDRKNWTISGDWVRGFTIVRKVK